MPVMEYFTSLKNKAGGTVTLNKTPQTPVLNDEDEKFLERLTSGEQAPPLPDRPVVILDNAVVLRGKDAQIALMDGANKVPLPSSPSAEVEAAAAETSTIEAKSGEPKEGPGSKPRDYLNYVRNIPSMMSFKGKGKEKSNLAGADSQSAVDAAKSGGEPVVATKAEKEDEERELSNVLDQLNLSAVNNRTFSFSEKSQEMMTEFTQILKDIVNGVPTAYDDLEKFLKNWDGHLRKMYGDLPPFLQSLVKSMPAKMGSTLAPGLLAAASDKPGADARAMGVNTSSSQVKRKIPSLKKLLASQGAVTSMLRSILSFLKLRFPAVLAGTNVLMSLAVFLLLFVFWYCYKRGRETRLERERLAVENANEDSDLDQTASELEDSAVMDDGDMQMILNQPTPASVPLPAASLSEAKH